MAEYTENLIDKSINKKPPKIKPYSENEALKRAQQKYREKKTESLD